MTIPFWPMDAHTRQALQEHGVLDYYGAAYADYVLRRVTRLNEKGKTASAGQACGSRTWVIAFLLEQGTLKNLTPKKNVNGQVIKYSLVTKEGEQLMKKLAA